MVFANQSETAVYAENLSKMQLNGQIKITYPMQNAVFPPEIAAPTFEWKDPDTDIDQWVAVVKSGGKIQYTSKFINEPNWRPDSTSWEQIKHIALGNDATVSILGVNKKMRGKIFNGGEVTFKISKDSVGAPIFFRAVPLPFGFAVSNLPTISWRLGDVSKYAPPKILLTNFPVCGNCHSFSDDGKTLGMDVDYANDKGSYFVSKIDKSTDITVDKIITWSDYKRDEKEFTFGLLSRVSPDGRYVLSTVKDRSIFVKVDNLDYSQLFFPIKGIIAIYDTKTQQYTALHGADDKDFVQSNPVWSRDGKTILFARAPVYHDQRAEQSKEVILPTEYASDFLSGKKGFKFDIYSVPFNDGMGGEAKPLEGASNNGMSNFFPKFSPDGKWVVFTQSENFMLLQPDSKLYIMPATGGKPRLMNCNNPETMNSWHSWSPNGKWLVFSSKARGPYTQLYLTHIDENGNDSPSILLESMMIQNRAANIPEFVNRRFDDFNKINERFIDNDNYAVARGEEKLRVGDIDGAIKEYDKAIALDPKDDISYNSRGIIKAQAGRFQEAIADFKKVLELKPNSFYAYYNMGNAKILMGDYKGAIEDLDKSIKMNPQGAKQYYSRGEAKFDMKDFEGAIKDFNISLQLNSQNPDAYSMRASAKYNIGKYGEAIEDFDKSVELNPKDSMVYFKRAISKLQMGMNESALIDLKESEKRGYPDARMYIDKFFENKK